MSQAVYVIEHVCSALEHGGNIAIDFMFCLKWNACQPHSIPTDVMYYVGHLDRTRGCSFGRKYCYYVWVLCEVLGIFIDDRLDFSKHISTICPTTARQLNALAWISKNPDHSSLKVIHDCFLSSDFRYCSFMLHFCGKVNNDKIWKIQERSLRILQIISFPYRVKCCE